MKTILIAACDLNNVIGNEGKIPWNIPEERNRFKEICRNKIVIMGRKSFDEIGHSLPYCTILIISKSLKNSPEGCLLADSISSAIEICKNQEEIIIAGGSSIYEQTIQNADKIYLTKINKTFKGDSFFPDFNQSLYSKTIEKQIIFEDFSYEYLTFTRL